MEQWASGHGLDSRKDSERLELQRAALTLLFRLLFVLYAEGSRLLPTDNATYRHRSLSALVAEAHATRPRLSGASTSLWSGFATLVRALRTGNPAWGVPAYNGALFADTGFEGAALLERLELDDPHFAQVLTAVGLDSETGRGVDYSSLEIGHLGHIYETLLSLQLAVADRDLSYDAGRDRYVADTGSPEVASGSLLWQTHEGGRKAGGVYYTPVSLVQHLVRQAVLPAFERHLGGVRRTAETDPRRAAEQLLDFAVLDPACGSAHFLVQVTEQLAERTVVFLAETPLPAIKEALDRLRSQARPGSEATDVTLLRRLILKHCVYGVDISPMGAEIATLSLWLASFVPGLSLAYLGRNVVVGNSLIGVASAGSVVEEGTLQEQSLPGRSVCGRPGWPRSTIALPVRWTPAGPPTTRPGPPPKDCDGYSTCGRPRGSGWREHESTPSSTAPRLSRGTTARTAGGSSMMPRFWRESTASCTGRWSSRRCSPASAAGSTPWSATLPGRR